MTAENNTGHQESPYQNFLENRDTFYSRLINLTRGVSALEQAIISFEALNKRTGSLKRQLETAQREKADVEGNFPPEVLKTGLGDQSRSVIDQIRQDAENNPDLQDILNIPSKKQEDAPDSPTPPEDEAKEEKKSLDDWFNQVKGAPLEENNELFIKNPKKDTFVTFDFFNQLWLTNQPPFLILTDPATNTHTVIPRPEVFPYDNVLYQNERLNNAGNVLRSAVPGIFALASAISDSAENQANIFRSMAHDILLNHLASPSKLPEWFKRLEERLPDVEFSSMDILRNQDQQMVAGGQGSERVKMFDFNDDEERSQVWKNRLGELKEAYQKNEFSKNHILWLDLLSRSVDMKKYISRLKELNDQESENQTPQAGEGGEQPPNEPPEGDEAPVAETPEPEDDHELENKKEAMERARDEYFEALNEAKEGQKNGWLSRLTRGKLRLPFRRDTRDKIEDARQKYLDARNDFGAYSAVDKIKEDPEAAGWSEEEFRDKLGEAAFDVLTKQELLTSRIEAETIAGRTPKIINQHQHWSKRMMRGLLESAGIAVVAKAANIIVPALNPAVFVGKLALRAWRGAITFEPAIHKFQDRFITGAEPFNDRLTEDHLKDLELDRLQNKYAHTYAARLRYGLTEPTSSESVMQRAISSATLIHLKKEISDKELKKDMDKKTLWQTLLEEVKQEKYNLELRKLDAIDFDRRGHVPRLLAGAAFGLLAGAALDWIIGNITDKIRGVGSSPAATTNPASKYGVKTVNFPNPDKYMNQLYGTDSHSSFFGFGQGQLPQSGYQGFAYSNHPNFAPNVPGNADQIFQFNNAWNQNPDKFTKLINAYDNLVSSMNPSVDFSSAYPDPSGHTINHFINGSLTELRVPDNTTLVFNDLAKQLGYSS